MEIILRLNIRSFRKSGAGNWVDRTGIWFTWGSHLEIGKPEVVAYGNRDLVAVSVRFHGEILYLLMDELVLQPSEMVH